MDVDYEIQIFGPQARLRTLTKASLDDFIMYNLLHVEPSFQHFGRFRAMRKDR